MHAKLRESASKRNSYRVATLVPHSAVICQPSTNLATPRLREFASDRSTSARAERAKKNSATLLAKSNQVPSLCTLL